MIARLVLAVFHLAVLFHHSLVLAFVVGLRFFKRQCAVAAGGFRELLFRFRRHVVD